MPDEITITSTTDSPEDLRAAMGLSPETTPAAEPVVVTPTPEPVATEVTDPPAAPEQPKKTKTQLRIERLVAERNDAEDRERATAHRIQDLEARLNALPAAPTTPAVVTPSPAEPEAPAIKARPKEDDFSSYEDYQDAVVEWKIEQKIGTVKPIKDAVKETLAQARAEDQQAAEFKTAVERYDGFMARGRTTHPDFDLRLAEAGDKVQLSRPMTDVLYNSTIPDEILYYFALNPTEASRITALPSPGAAFVEMGKIEAKLEAKMSKTTEPQAATPTRTPVSRAPEPISPVGNSPVVPSTNPDEMSFEEYRKWRNSQGARR